MKLFVKMAAAAMMVTLSATASGKVLVEAESFKQRGGWKIDTQFIDNMGSPYLMAHGLGHRVEDAETIVNFPSTGKWHLWVRTKDWVAHWKAPGTPGRFGILIDDQPVDQHFGIKGADWHWQYGGQVNIKNKQSKIALRDLTGFNGRCDAIYFAKDRSDKPNNSSEVLNKWRRNLLGIKVINMPKQYDLVVTGGGFSGMGAAIAAARMGLKVALIQNRPVLGGNGSSEIRVAPRGQFPKGLYPLGDFVKEMSPWTHENVLTPDQYHDAQKLKLIQSEKNIDLFLNHHAYKVEMKNKEEIKATLAFDVRSNTIRRFTGKYFCDATGHGTIGLWAGADYTMEEKDRMGMSNLWRWKYTKKIQKFPETPWALPLEQKMFPYPNKRANWFWESGFDKHPLKDLELIRDWNLRAAFGAWNAIKNKGAHAWADKSGNKHAYAELEWVAHIGGTRETLQLVGDVVLSKEDVVSNRKFDDACVFVTWGLDLHYAHPLYAKHNPENPFISRAHFGGRVDDTKGKLATSPTMYVHSKDGHGVDRKKGYAIPYRTFYSRNINNLFMAGRNVSCTHTALGTIRVMQTLGMVGAVVGRATYIAEKHNTTPRQVYQKHLKEFKEVLSLPAKHRQ